MAGKVPAAAEMLRVPTEAHVVDFAQADIDEGIRIKTEMGKWGPRLPIGFLAGKELHKGFELKPFGWNEEEKLAEIKRDNRQMTVQAFVVEVLAEMLVSLGPWKTLDGLGLEERRMIVNHMFLGDVMYVYITLRVQAMGEIAKFPIKCPNCKKEANLPADLMKTDMTAVDGEGAQDTLVVAVDLRDGVKTPDGREKRIYVAPPRWMAMAALKHPDDMSSADMKRELITSGVRQVGQGKHQFTSQSLRSLSKFDLERLSKAIDDLSPGLDLVVEAQCRVCRAEWRIPLQWDWDFLFTAASL